MSTLPKEFRRQLENAVLKAREEAERGAAAAQIAGAWPAGGRRTPAR